MTPTLDTRLKSIVSAMEDIIIPAIDPKDSLPLQQASLIVGHVRMILEQLPFTANFEWLCLEDMAVTARAVLVLPGLESQSDKAKELARILDERTGVAADRYTAIGRALEAMIEAAQQSGNIDLLEQVAEPVLAFGERQTLRERVWFSATGFDPMRSELPAIEALCRAAGDASSF